MEIGTEGHKPMEVLLCEDSPGDVRLTREAFHVANETVNLHVVADGVEAMAYLKSEHDHCPRPDLILLDLNMPRMGGREVLAYLKTDDHFKTIPVVILTTSASEADVEECYRLAANCYLQESPWSWTISKGWSKVSMISGWR